MPRAENLTGRAQDEVSVLATLLGLGPCHAGVLAGLLGLTDSAAGRAIAGLHGRGLVEPDVTDRAILWRATEKARAT